MATRAHIPLLAALSALAAGPAGAKVYVEWKPRASFFAGFNDNVLLDGSGADGFGQARPGIRLDLFGDHQFHVNVDCEAGIGRLLHPDKFALNNGGAFATSERCIAHYKDRWSPRTASHVLLRSTYAQDPFAISGLGLLLRAGQTQVFSTSLSAEVDHAVSPRAQWRFGLDSQVLAFGANDPGNGAVFTPSIGYAYRTSPYDNLTLTGREQLFYSFGATPQASAPQGVPGGIVTEAHSLRLGWERRLRPWATLKASGGPLYVTGQNGGQFSPTAKLEIESLTPGLAARLIVSHDLIIGASRAGAIVGNLAEVATLITMGDFTGGLRAGVYRNSDLPSQFTAMGPAGYSGEVSLDSRIGREWTVGLAALRDARLNDTDVGRQVDRDVVQLRLTWERFQPF